MQRFTTFILVPLGIALGVFYGFQIARGGASWADVMQLMTAFVSIWLTIVVIEMVLNFICETFPMFIRALRRAARDDEHGHTEIPLERDGQVWGKVTLFNPPKEKQRDYKERRITKWIAAIGEHFRKERPA